MSLSILKGNQRALQLSVLFSILMLFMRMCLDFAIISTMQRAEHI